MANVFDVADFMILSAGQESDMTNMKINKLLYYAQGTHLARTGKPLFNDDIKAWDHGPVVTPVWRKYTTEHGSNPILETSEGFDADKSFSQEEADTIIDVICEYGKYAASYLRNKTHAPGTPWSSVAHNDVISKNLLRQYFSQHEAAERFDFASIKLPAIGYLNEDGILVIPKDDEDWSEYDEV